MRDVRCGLVLWTLYCKATHPETKVNTETLEKDLQMITLEKVGSNLKTLFTKMEDLCIKIKAEKGHKYDEDRYTTMLFDKISGYKQEYFQFDFKIEKQSWNKAIASSNR